MSDNQYEMRPVPDHGETSYKGFGRLSYITGEVLGVTGGNTLP